MGKTYYVTTPIYYVNDVPTIGHSYTTIAADVLARFFRAAGRDVHFLTGTDEHGVKIVKAAADKGKSPRQLADEVVVGFQRLWKALDITHDDFIRTTEARHERRVREIVRRLVERDEIYLGRYEGWYDEGQEEYVTESTARDNGYKSEINGKPLVKYSEENWFFRLKKWAPKLIAHIEDVEGFIRPVARRNEVLSKLKLGVEDLCISRNKDKLPWGVEMPNDPDHVVYVWIDALSNYITALGLPPVGDEADEAHAQYWPADVHLIGKDILWFHTVYWPCMLMALAIPLPKCVFAHGWWTHDGRKMSKSLNNFISREQIAEYCQEFSRDVLKYYLLRAMTFGADGDFSRDKLLQTYNAELANGVGNLLSRTVKMISKYFDGVVPAPRADVAETAAVRAAAAALHEQAEPLMERCAFHQYLGLTQALVAATDGLIEATQPFKLAKDPDQHGRLATILSACAEAVRIVLTYLGPILADSSAEGLARLGAKGSGEPFATAGQWSTILTGAAVRPGEPLFPRKP